MSANYTTFSGLLEDEILQFLCIDLFESKTYGCESFLLSHYHFDHMKGLFRSNFAEILNTSEEKRIYCSPLTTSFLTKNPLRSFVASKIIPLEICKPTIIKELPTTDVVVTALPAGHCPGSVMFLIEYNNKRILYTGDFRISVSNFKEIKSSLTNADKTIKKINDLYLDTTFAVNSEYNNFPPREKCEKVLLQLVDEWLCRNAEHKVFIRIPACIGTEYLYISLYKRFKKKVVVHGDAFHQFYAHVDEVAMCVESYDCAQDEWSIHVCNKGDCNVRMNYKNTKIIKPCVLPFVRNTFLRSSLKVNSKYGVPYISESDDRYVKVFYSSHCSLNELKEVVEFVNPDRIFYNTRYEDSCELLPKNKQKSGISSGENTNSKSKEVQFPKKRKLCDTELEKKAMKVLKLRPLN